MMAEIGVLWFIVRCIIAAVVFWRAWTAFGFWWGVLLGLFWEVWLAVRYVMPWVLHQLGL